MKVKEYLLVGIFLVGRRTHTHSPAPGHAAQTIPEQALSQEKG